MRRTLAEKCCIAHWKSEKRELECTKISWVPSKVLVELLFSVVLFDWLGCFRQWYTDHEECNFLTTLHFLIEIKLSLFSNTFSQTSESQLQAGSRTVWECMCRKKILSVKSVNLEVYRCQVIGVPGKYHFGLSEIQDFVNKGSAHY